MRRVMMAMMAVAVAGMVTTGCSRKSELQRQREDMAEARIDLAKAKKEQHTDITKTRVEEQKDVARVQQKTDERQELAEAQAHDPHELLDPGELSGTGGSGTTASQGAMVTGTVQAITDKNLTLIIPAEDNRLMRFMANDEVPVMRDQLPVTLQSLKAGDEVRASYRVDQSGLLILRSLDVTKVSAPQPAMRQ